jgi:hypothetical protein
MEGHYDHIKDPALVKYLKAEVFWSAVSEVVDEAKIATITMNDSMSDPTVISIEDIWDSTDFVKLVYAIHKMGFDDAIEAVQHGLDSLKASASTSE